MKKFKQVFIISTSALIVGCGVLAFLLQPVLGFGQLPTYRGNNRFSWKMPMHDPSKKTVLIIADNKMTEMFDLLAPFYLFNATDQLNVYIVAKDKKPILIRRELFVLPQLTFGQADSLKLVADVIVIPALSIRDEKQDPAVIAFIKTHFTPATKMLAVCDGASTAAATGFYDGKPITCHASDYAGIKSHFNKPAWVQGVNVTRSGNLYSTGGVSNATEGSLTVINDLLGTATMKKVATGIYYPHLEILTVHQSIALGFGNEMAIAGKVIFGPNHKIGFLLQNGTNEFNLASVLDTYGRTFPKFLKTYTLTDSTVQTQYGLTLVHTGGNVEAKQLDEVHILMPEFETAETALFGDTKVIGYGGKNKYLINVCLQQIDEQYSHKLQNVVKLMLDYN